MIFYDMTEDQLNQVTTSYLGQTNITNTSPGARAQTILMMVNKVLRSYYSALDFNVMMAFVSKATGAFLDEIGALLNCVRQTDESDSNYRYRITNQVNVVEGANQSAIRLAALSVPNVVDVVLTPFTYGTGSFSVHVITDSVEHLDEAVAAVQSNIDQVEAFGIKGIAVAPKILDITLWLVLSFANGVSDGQKQTTAGDIQRAIKGYIDGLGIGDEMILSSIIQAARDTGGQYLLDASISRIEVNGEPVVLDNYLPYWDEKLFVSDANDINLL